MRVKSRLCVLHFGKVQFATVDACKHGLVVLNKRRSCAMDSGEEVWNFAVSLSLLCSSTNSVRSGAGTSFTGKSKGAVNSLKSVASGLTPAKRKTNSSLREATTLT